jgi:Holliday junction resolvase
MMANNQRYLVVLSKDEIESIIKFLRLFGGPPEDALLQRFERRLRQIASHEEMLARFDNEPGSDITL